MNGRYLIVTRLAAVLVTASLFLVGCERGEARGEEGARPSSETAAPAPEQRTTVPDDGEPVDEPGGPADAASAPDGAPAAPTSGTSPNGGNSSAGQRTAAGAGDPAARRGSTTASPRPAASDEPARGPETSSSPGASPDEILRTTARAYEGLRSFRAGFDQTLRNTLLGRTTTSSGTLYQRQPDRFLMDFSDPPDDVIVSDGDFFWMYFPSVDTRQVLRTPRGGQGLDLRAQFIGDPVRRFETTYHGTDAVRGRDAHVMTLVPRESLGYERLKVWIDARDHLVRRFELTEGNGIIRHFELRDLLANPTLPNDLFAFTPPPGTQVVTR